ncbi:MAG: aldehyde ferredoxin oxidoreductase C-terminal domain-containing protein [Acidobacteriota bacterium]
MRLERILRVELESRRTSFEPLSAAERRMLGGAALGVRLLHDQLSERIDPLHPAAPWILSIGPLSGTALSPRAQAAITHLSPLTGGVNDSLVSHAVAEALAAAGIAALILTGRSESPVWLRLGAQGVEIEDARSLWSQDLGRTAQALESRHAAAALIVGSAAQSGVPYASLGTGGHSAGRGGAGAALAAKNVKAIAARRGSARAAAGGRKNSGGEAREPRGARAARRLLQLNELRALPTRNFRERSFPEAPALARALNAGGRYGRLPYEAAFAFGPLLGISSAECVRRCLEACDRVGLDVISAGGTLAWAIEAARAGVLPERLLEFGQAEPLEPILESIASRVGVGELLALGSRAAGRQLGGQAGHWAMHVRGLEIPGYDPRAFPSLALGYAIGSRGACHVRSGAYQIDLDSPHADPPEAAEVARRAVESEDASTLLDSLIFNRSWRSDLGDPFEGAARLLDEAGERDLADTEALRETMRCVSSLRRRINLAQGWRPEEDGLPERLLRESGGASSALDAARLRAWIASYYTLRGWSAEGRPA